MLHSKSFPVIAAGSKIEKKRRNIILSLYLVVSFWMPFFENFKETKTAFHQKRLKCERETIKTFYGTLSKKTKSRLRWTSAHKTAGG